VSVVEVKDLHKAYGSTEALRGIDLTVEAGEVYALLGPNGAGKSTTVEILEGHGRPSSGHVRVLGLDPATAGREYRDRIGIVLQQSGIEDELSVIEALEMYASVYSEPADPYEVLELVGLADRPDHRVKKLSGGQQRRIDLALGLIGNPDVLFLDEPTTGFDPSARRRSWDLVAGLRTLGTTILLTTHYMDEAQHLADRVGVIVGGEIVAEGTPTELMQAAGETLISFEVSAETALDDFPLDGVERSGTTVTLGTTDPTRALHDLTGWALSRSVELMDLSVARPSLEDVYLGLAEGADAADAAEAAVEPDAAKGTEGTEEQDAER
jgi:ABC-2 type transport system ATP-binding protein